MPRNGKRSGPGSGRSRSLDPTKSALVKILKVLIDGTPNPHAKHQIFLGKMCGKLDEDFTLYDYAHSTVLRSHRAKTGRLKKGEANAFHAQAKKVCGKSTVMLADNSLEWFEKDINDFNLSDDEATFILLKEQSENGITVGNFGNCPRRKLEREELTNHGTIYPLDVWFLIGRHIHPEDVASFSAICHCSHIVVHSARFWISLYKRFYNPGVDLPIPLQPSMLERVHGVKSRVVRALFYFYLPFQNRLRCMVPFENDPDLLEGKRCVRMWHQQVKNSWHFYFKFERVTPPVCPLFPVRSEFRTVDSLRAEANALYNREENCTVLQVVSPGFILLPDVVGQILIKTFVSVGHEMRSHRLKLVFHTNQVRSTKVVLTNGTTITMDPVTNIHILRWWDPRYPCIF